MRHISVRARPLPGALRYQLVRLLCERLCRSRCKEGPGGFSTGGVRH